MRVCCVHDAYLGEGVRRGPPEIGEEIVNLAASADALHPEGVLAFRYRLHELPPFARGPVPPALFLPHGCGFAGGVILNEVFSFHAWTRAGRWSLNPSLAVLRRLKSRRVVMRRRNSLARSGRCMCVNTCLI